VLDDHSRLCIASTTRRIFTAGDVNTAVTAATSAYGDPAGLLSDNGAVFTGTHAAAAGSPSRSPAVPAGSGSPIPGPTTRRPAEKSSASTKP